jgi:hypothetical protein
VCFPAPCAPTQNLIAIDFSDAMLTKEIEEALSYSDVTKFVADLKSSYNSNAVSDFLFFGNFCLPIICCIWESVVDDMRDSAWKNSIEKANKDLVARGFPHLSWKCEGIPRLRNRNPLALKLEDSRPKVVSQDLVGELGRVSAQALYQHNFIEYCGPELVWWNCTSLQQAQEEAAIACIDPDIIATYEPKRPGLVLRQWSNCSARSDHAERTAFVSAASLRCRQDEADAGWKLLPPVILSDEIRPSAELESRLAAAPENEMYMYDGVKFSDHQGEISSGTAETLEEAKSVAAANCGQVGIILLYHKSIKMYVIKKWDMCGKRVLNKDTLCIVSSASLRARPSQVVSGWMLQPETVGPPPETPLTIPTKSKPNSRPSGPAVRRPVAAPTRRRRSRGSDDGSDQENTGNMEYSAPVYLPAQEEPEAAPEPEPVREPEPVEQPDCSEE